MNEEITSRLVLCRKLGQLIPKLKSREMRIAARQEQIASAATKKKKKSSQGVEEEEEAAVKRCER